MVHLDESDLVRSCVRPVVEESCCKTMVLSGMIRKSA
jgi:hypothetical protein